MHRTPTPPGRLQSQLNNFFFPKKGHNRYTSSGLNPCSLNCTEIKEFLLPQKSTNFLKTLLSPSTLTQKQLSTQNSTVNLTYIKERKSPIENGVLDLSNLNCTRIKEFLLLQKNPFTLLKTLILPSTLTPKQFPKWLTPERLNSMQLQIFIKPESIKNETVDLSWIEQRNITVLIDGASLEKVGTIHVGESTNVKIVVQGQSNKTAQHIINVQKQDPRNKKKAYYDQPGLSDRNYNYKVKFKDNSKKWIACRHLVKAWLAQRQLQTQKKTSTANNPQTSRQESKFGEIWQRTTGSLENMQAQITSDTQHQYAEIRYKTKENYLVGHGKASWEGFLDTLFKTMEGEGCRAKGIAMRSGRHAMGLELQVKQEAHQKTEYWISFYDSNSTQVQKHIAYQPNNQEKSDSIITQLIGAKRQKLYYGEKNNENHETVSMLHVAYSVDQAGETMPDKILQANAKRSTEYFIEQKPIDASGVHALLSDNLLDISSISLIK